MTDNKIAAMRQLSPLRQTTDHTTASELSKEQARHFGLEPGTPFADSLINLAIKLYESGAEANQLWSITIDALADLDNNDKIAWFNAKRFICYQIAKILDNLQNPLRATYQSIVNHNSDFSSKGSYPLFDNVAALFSATPAITRTATYVFACTEWVEDAFKGREPLHNVYSRLLNPTSISLANHIIDLECGSLANQYMAWNFNSGMAAIDGILSHLLGYEDMIVASRNIYGGSYQLLHDWYAKKSNLNINIKWVDGWLAEDFAAAVEAMCKECSDRIKSGRKIYVYLESPCNPHGFVLDVANICRVCHKHGLTVIADTTVATPFLFAPLKNDDVTARPDFIVHSYTKDLAGFGTTTAGCLIGRNEHMFLPKNSSARIDMPDGSTQTINWDDTVFWNVYYIKGAFLDADKAFEVITGIKTLEMRLLQKAINTLTIARCLDHNRFIKVSCPGLDNHPNNELVRKYMFLQLPAGLFTIDFVDEVNQKLPLSAFKQFLDLFEPYFGMQVSLGQNNSLALCPGITTHSELNDEALAKAGISRTTIRLAVGLEDPRSMLNQLTEAANIAIDPVIKDFSTHMPTKAEIDKIYHDTYVDVHSRFISHKTIKRP